MLLYFLAGLLPNPDGPWSPDASHGHAWITAMLLEAVIAAVFKTQQRSIRVPAHILDELFALGIARIVVLLVMTAILVRRHYALRSSTAASTPEEREGLLENGQGPVGGYNGVHGHGPPSKPAARKPRDAQSSGWFDYIAGFRVLFPYLWPKDSPLYQIVVVICVILLIAQRVVNIMVPLQLGTLVDSLGYVRIFYFVSPPLAPTLGFMRCFLEEHPPQLLLTQAEFNSLGAVH